jgi:hypothetical protein
MKIRRFTVHVIYHPPLEDYILTDTLHNFRIKSSTNLRIQLTPRELARGHARIHSR